jgi:aminoglycoside 6'-N-acetyltransferase I
VSAAVEIRLLHSGDEPVLERVAPDVFDNPIDPALAREFLADPRHHIAVAISDGIVVGMASAVHYIHPDKPMELWVNEVAVAPTHQQRGIGKRLLAALLDHGRALGCKQAWLGAEESNMAARRLYVSAGAQEAPMVYVTFDLCGKSPSGG